MYWIIFVRRRLFANPRIKERYTFRVEVVIKDTSFELEFYRVERLGRC